MTHTYIAQEEQFCLYGTEAKTDRVHVTRYRLGSSLFTAAVAAAIWFYVIAPDDKSPNTLMVEPATELLSTFVQPAADMPTLSKDVGFTVKVPNLGKIGVEVTTVGESNFVGRPAAVVQYHKGYSTFLMYSFNHSTNLFGKMRKVNAVNHNFYITSGGEVSVVAWKDNTEGYKAIAAKLTEEDLLALAENIAESA